MGDISRLAVTVGPGSYTGLRIGLSFVKGLAMPQNIPCVGVSTLHALAYNLASRDGRVLSVLDARAGQVYAALFEIQSGIVTRLTPDGACLLSTLETALGTGTMAVGDGAELAAHYYSHRNLQAAPMEQRYLRASSVAAAAAVLPKVRGDALVPNYHRKSQAEREREAKSEGRNS
jgi:tRNA threonylcarbamoyladenosine biosynthesis protein TsaB